MKSLCKAIAVGLLVGMTTTTSFSASLPDNYNGLKWGTDVSKLPEFKFSKNADGFKVFTKNGDSMQVEGKKASSVLYYTRNNLLSSVEVTYNRMSCDSIYAKTKGKYGKSSGVSQDETPIGTISVAKWSNNRTMLSLTDFASNASGATKKKYPNWCVWSIGDAGR